MQSMQLQVVNMDRDDPPNCTPNFILPQHLSKVANIYLWNAAIKAANHEQLFAFPHELAYALCVRFFIGGNKLFFANIIQI